MLPIIYIQPPVNISSDQAKSYTDDFKQHFTCVIRAAVSVACIPPGSPDISQMMDSSSMAIPTRSPYIIMQIRGKRTQGRLLPNTIFLPIYGSKAIFTECMLWDLHYHETSIAALVI